MAKIGIIRCEKNEHKCPLTSCLKSLADGAQGYAAHQGPNTLVGVFTCRCPGDQAENLGKILKSKGTEVVHWCTCLFAHKEEGRWQVGDGLCRDVDALIQRVARGADIACVKGTAHLPEGYRPEVFGKGAATRGL